MNAPDINVERMIRLLRTFPRGLEPDCEERMREFYAWYFAQPDCPARCVQQQRERA